ncbi:MAG: hypothetical protein ACO3C1_02940 [Ilumatobacteraceae bacterium]
MIGSGASTAAPEGVTTARDAALDGVRAVAVAAVMLYHADAVSPGRHLATGDPGADRT